MSDTGVSESDDLNQTGSEPKTDTAQGQGQEHELEESKKRNYDRDVLLEACRLAAAFAFSIGILGPLQVKSWRKITFGGKTKATGIVTGTFRNAECAMLGT